MNNKITLFSYTIPFDDGAAPNPYWDILTLAICKPVIRRTAKVGDWIVGTGSKKSPIGDIQHKIVYVMKVTDKKSLKEYDTFCKQHLPNKIPDINNKNLLYHIGDCIYDYSKGNEPILRPSVHGLGNRDTDLGGENVLLSDHFFYFGNNPHDLPKKFHRLIKPNQGHRSRSNDDIVEEFIDWFDSLNLTVNKLYGSPQKVIDFSKDKNNAFECAKYRCEVHIKDEEEFRDNIC